MLMTARWIIAMRPLRAGGTARVGDALDAAFRVLPSDLDMLMHMTNGRYLSILDAARIAYMSRTGLWRALRARRWHPVVVAQTINYRRSLTLGTRYLVRTSVIGVDDRNVYFDQEFLVGDVTHASAVVAIRYLDHHGASIQPEQLVTLAGDTALPQSLPTWITEWSAAARAHTAGERFVQNATSGTQA